MHNISIKRVGGFSYPTLSKCLHPTSRRGFNHLTRLIPSYSPAGQDLIRDIAKPTSMPNLENGPWTVEMIDAYVGEWVDRGYDLVSTHYLGEIPEGYKVLYVLKKLG